MGQVISRDGTTIAFDQVGEGPAVILVGGALGDRSHPGHQHLAALLAQHFSVFNYDRRGRGESGDTLPYAVEREIEDIDALIDLAGGSAFVYGVSSGAILALEAANALGAKVEKLALYEPPFIINNSRPPLPPDYVEQINTAVAAGRRGDALVVFMTRALLLPDEYLAAMQADPMWAGLEKVAHTLAYDGTIARDFMAGKPLPAKRWNAVTAPTLVLSGGHSEQFFHDGAQALAALLPNARWHTLEGQNHAVEPQTLAPVLIEFFGPASLSIVPPLHKQELDEAESSKALT